ncbi:prolyl oligopeptidase family serine peptidase [Frankia sp. AgB1.9]|uniref:alpha/beta hydrolase n=1 Tax=unclassified Frankia TaxID=2632575 RepID=UPI001933CF22|nr:MULTISPECIES: alpha/beta hydrolase family protein [unclassified Frankia]MBL7489091.1 prolyl oligopeptidase family serine peptidase [Frankia sp. AgW1.1]MBL7550819.1 prolyl oligopeptidase family serine peptidase [Frankia sp. AgB1.9]MBL7618178.1 prolyl oligopeptidase family serine peptidase [Frankia sp. AgB1.8]
MPAQLSTRRRRWIAVATAVVAVAMPLGLAGAGPAAGSAAAPAATGTPVAPVAQVNQSTSGGDNPKTGTVPDTATLGVPDPGTVPVVGLATAKAADGARVLYETRVDARTVDLMISSPALGGAAPVRLMLPPSWTADPTATFPALYLIHGCCEKADYQSWSLYTDVEAATADKNVLVVMPSDGSAGFGTNWWNFGMPNKGWGYDTFLATEVPQILRAGYRASGRAAIAGVSIGAYAAVALAALHPGEYGAAASFSGLLDTQTPVVSTEIAAILVRESQNPLAMWGDPVLLGLQWLYTNPTALLGRLKGVGLFVSSGNGNPGPLDPANTESSLLDTITLANSTTFVTLARLSGLKPTVDFYGAGTHSWPYWNRELARSWPVLAAGLGLPAS